MPTFETRHVLVALVAAFVLGIGGAAILSGGGGSPGSTAIAFDPGTDEQEESTPSPTPSADKGGFTAEAVKQGKRIVITGEGAEPGAKLVVQRKESSGWQDFPAHATATKDGSYSTYIITSRDGTYRVKDTSSDAASKPVSVKI